MKKDYIVVIDSGVGGLSTLAKCIRHTKVNYIYVADNKNHPYGTHSKQEIVSFLTEIITNLKKFCDFNVVILACNTATTAAIEDLRKRFPDLIFIGTEPAIKLAYNFSYRNILALTTPSTACQKKFIDLKNSLPCNIKTLSISCLAQNIENHLLSRTYFSYVKLLKNIFQIAASSQGFDCIVLGCTHYVFLKEILNKYTNLPLIDGNTGVQKQLAKIIKSSGIQADDNFRIKFMNTLMLNGTNQIYKKILSQILANSKDLC